MRPKEIDKLTGISTMPKLLKQWTDKKNRQFRAVMHCNGSPAKFSIGIEFKLSEKTLMGEDRWHLIFDSSSKRLETGPGMSIFDITELCIEQLFKEDMAQLDAMNVPPTSDTVSEKAGLAQV